MDSYLGEIRLWTSVRIPTNWANCDGSTLLINDYESLYAVIGTAWGGDGVTNFKLPDLRGRLPAGQGNGPGLAPCTLAQTFGTETVALTADNLPAHTHAMMANTTPAASTTPSSATVLAAGGGSDTWYASGTTLNKAVLATNAIGSSGGNGAHANVMPCVALTYIICTNGLFPSRGN